MIRVKLTTAFPQWPIVNQTPGRLGKWGDFQFVVDYSNDESYDFWVVCEDTLGDQQSAVCPPENTIFVPWEHSNHYQTAFLNQFGTVLWPYEPGHELVHKMVPNQPAVPWHVYRRIEAGLGGVQTFPRGYDELAVARPEKTKLLSVIASTKLPWRLELAQKIKEYFGTECDFFGWGGNHIADKWDAVAPYKYHVAIENIARPLLLSEKLMDPYLAGAFPFYYGGDIASHFPDGAAAWYTIPQQASTAILIIKRGIDAGLYETSQAQLARAKDLVLNEYNLFPTVVDLIHRRWLDPAARKQTVTLKRNGLL